MRNANKWRWAIGGLKAVFVAVVPGALLAYVAWRVLRRVLDRAPATTAVPSLRGRDCVVAGTVV